MTDDDRLDMMLTHCLLLTIIFVMPGLNVVLRVLIGIMLWLAMLRLLIGLGIYYARQYRLRQEAAYRKRESP